jgi:hypothetical protein
MTCEVEECGNRLPEGSELTTCWQCRAGFRYWRKKKPAEVMLRRRRLRKYQDRLNFLREE